MGTYNGRGSQVYIKKENDKIIISDLTDKELCRHPISSGKGQVVTNTNLRRDNSGAIEEIIGQVSKMFDNPQIARQYLEAIHGEKPRYIRDQITLIRQTIEKHEQQTVNEALAYCCSNCIYSAVDFKAVVEQKTRNKEIVIEPVITRVNPLSGSLSTNATIKPNTSKIIDYQILMQNKN